MCGKRWVCVGDAAFYHITLDIYCYYFSYGPLLNVMTGYLEIRI